MKKAAIIFFLIVVPGFAAMCQESTNEQLAAQYYSSKEYDKAIPYYEKVYAKSPTSYNYHNYLDCLVQTKDYKAAEKLIKKQMKEDESNLVLWVDLGTLYQLQGDDKKAKEAFEKAIHKLTDNRNQVLALGAAFTEKKEWDYALETYKRGKSLVSDQYPFLFETGAVYKAMGNITAMADCYLDALKISPTYIQSVQDALQISVGDNANDAQNALIKKELIRYAQRYTDDDIYAQLLVWLMIQQKDYANALVQVKALDKRKHEGGWRVLNLARTCASDNAYDVAIQAYQYVIDMGRKSDYYPEARSEQLKVMYRKLITGGKYSQQDLVNIQTRYKEALNELGINSGTIPLIEDIAYIEGFYLNEADSAEDILNRAISNPGISPITAARCRMELADVMVASGKVWEASLTYSKVQDAFDEDPIGEEARLKNAEVYFYTGNFKWAKAQLDILKAATSKPTANDAMALSLLIDDNSQDSANLGPLRLFAHAMLFNFSNRDDSAIILLDSIASMSATTPSLDEEMLMMRASIAMKKADYDSAVKFYEEEIKNHPDGLLPDKALYLLAQLEELDLKQPDKAADYYKQIILKYPGSYYVEDARDRYRHLSKTDAAPAMPN